MTPRRVAATRTAAGALVAALCLVGVPAGRAAESPAAATVMIRVQGEIAAALGPDMKAWRPSVEVREVQIGTGSGFIVSPAGYVLTNSHVIRGRQAKVSVEGQIVELTISVRAIYVVVPPRPGDPAAPQLVEAAVVADDPQVDLAVLHIGAQDLPVAALGDARTLSRGDPVSALGYPLGDRLAVTGTESEGGAPPPVSASTGTVAALREGGAAGLPATVPYVQFTAPINPGNSGGPLADRDGYVVGVVQAKLRQAEGVALAIAVEEVKRFLERTGIDSALPGTRLTPGLQFELAEKGLRARWPGGFSDASDARARIDSGASLNAIRLLIDRAASPWDPARVERALLEGPAFGAAEFVALPDRLRDLRTNGRVRIGLAARTGEAGESRMLYAVIGAGGEVVVARFVGPADDIAFNLSLLCDSLLSIEVAPLAPRPVAAPLSARTTELPAGDASRPVRVVPAGTIVDGATSAGCSGLPAPVRSLVVTPASDFTVRFVAAAWPAETSAEEIRHACLGAGSGLGTLRWSHLGVSWTGERAVVTPASGTPVLLELWAPAEKFAFAREAFRAWGEAVSR